MLIGVPSRPDLSFDAICTMPALLVALGDARRALKSVSLATTVSLDERLKTSRLAGLMSRVHDRRRVQNRGGAADRQRQRALLVHRLLSSTDLSEPNGATSVTRQQRVGSTRDAAEADTMFLCSS
jgi:hypothetical protein